MNKKRILAIAALVLIACMYLVTIVCALIDRPFARSCLMASLFCTIVIPCIAYGFLIITRIGQRRAADAKEADEKDN